MIRKVEAPEIFARHEKNDGFFVKPVLIGLGYDDANDALDAPAGFQDLGDWNLHRLDSDTLEQADAEHIARTVLAERLKAITAAGPPDALRLGLFTRRPDNSLQFDLRHDFTPYFDGRTAAPGAIGKIERALLDTASAVAASDAPNTIVCEGFASLPLAVLFGAIFSPLAAFKLIWRQALAGCDAQDWSLAAGAGDMKLNVKTVLGDLDSEALILGLGVNANIEPAVNDYLRSENVKPRAYVYVEPEGGPIRQGVSLSPQDGLALALEAINALHNLKDQLRLRTPEVHIFLACPLAMGMLIGQKLNTFSTCYLYEHVSHMNPPYMRFHSFNPSAFSYHG